MSENFIRLLLVEDNSGDVLLLRKMLDTQEPGKFTLTNVGRMSEAENYLAKNAQDIILLDLGLPDAEGLEVVRRARAAAPRTPLIVLTGCDELVRKGLSKSEAANRLLIQCEQCAICAFFRPGALDGEGNLPAVRSCDIQDLLPFDTIIEEELRTKTGLLLVAKGQQVRPTLILKLKNFLDRSHRQQSRDFEDGHARQGGDGIRRPDKQFRFTQVPLRFQNGRNPEVKLVLRVSELILSDLQHCRRILNHIAGRQESRYLTSMRTVDACVHTSVGFAVKQSYPAVD